MVQECQRVLRTAFRAQAVVEVVCFGPQGIEGVKDALRAGKQVHVEDIIPKIVYIAAPRYLVECCSTIPAQAERALNFALEHIMRAIESVQGGRYHLTSRTSIEDGIDANPHQTF